MIDEKTPHLKLPLPHADNLLEDDVLRLRQALNALDTNAKEAAATATKLNGTLSNVQQTVTAAATTAVWGSITGKPTTFLPSGHKASHKTGGNDALTPADIGAATTGHTHPVQTTISGNAGTATKLQTARTISISGGATGRATSFNGSANITIPVTALDVSKANAGTLPIARGGTGRTDGKAIALATARTIHLTGDVTGSANFDGNSNVEIATTNKKVSSAMLLFWGNF